MSVKRRRHVPTDAPEVHASQHATAGADAIAPSDIGASGTAHTHTHAATTGQGTDDHHAQAHTNADHSAAGTPSTQAFGDAAAAGSSTSDAKSDHKHAMPAAPAGGTPAPVLSTSAAAGNATTFLRTNDQIAVFDATVPSTQALADAAAAGSVAFAARRDHLHGMPTVAQVITALGGQVGGLPLIGELASDFLFTVSNTTLQSITGMSFSIGASATEVWLVEVFIELTAANATMDNKFGWTVPASATMRWGAASGSVAGSGSYAAAATGNNPLQLQDATVAISLGSLLTNAYGISFVGKVYGGGTGGTVQFQGAQNTSDAGQLTMKAGSVLVARKIKA